MGNIKLHKFTNPRECLTKSTLCLEILAGAGIFVAVARTKLASKPERARSKTPVARTKAAKTAASRRAGASAAVSAG